MKKEFAPSVFRSIIGVWAQTYEISVLNFVYTSEDCISFTISCLDTLPLHPISMLHQYLGAGVTIKTTLLRGGITMSVAVTNYWVGHIKALWDSKQSYYGR